MAERKTAAAGRLAGIALLLSGLALNPLALAHFLQQNPPDIQGILALQVALIISGGWLVWHRPPLPLVPTALASVALSIAHRPRASLRLCGIPQGEGIEKFGGENSRPDNLKRH